MKYLMTILCLMTAFVGHAQSELPLTDTPELSQKEMDRKAIKAQAGVFVVDFHFQETVGFEIGYDLKPAYDSAASEIVILEEESEDRIVLQHVLQTKHGIIKHWRQDWIYENRQVWEYQGDSTWRKRTISEADAKGTWTQRVFQVDDSPRYEAVGRWVHQGNLSQWTSELTPRPLPRREYTKRDDYNILMATNRVALTPTGWVHEQDNTKLRRNEKGDHLIAREYGLNTYDHANPETCAEAKAWWDEHREFWRGVRQAWTDVFEAESELVLAKKVEDKRLYHHLFALGDEAAKGEAELKEYHQQASVIIDKFRQASTTAESGY